MSSNIIKGLLVTYLDVPNAVGKHVIPSDFAIYTSITVPFYFLQALKAYPNGEFIPHQK